jgi:hypothetical protein
MAKKIAKLTDVTPDPANANRHTPRGASMMETSMREVGFGDSLTVDKHGIVISGHQRQETAVDLGMVDAIVVQSDGTKPIIHQRVDLDAREDRARRLALFSNRVGETNLEWDVEMLKQLEADGLELDQLWTPDELSKLMGDDEAAAIEPLQVDRPKDVAWLLLAIPVEEWPLHQDAVEQLQLSAKFSTMVLRPKDGSAGTTYVEKTKKRKKR